MVPRSRDKLAGSGLPDALVARLWNKRALWLVRMPPQDIAKLHSVELSTVYVFS